MSDSPWIPSQGVENDPKNQKEIMKKLHNLITYADLTSKVISDPRDDIMSKILELSKEILHEDRKVMQNQSILMATTVKTERLEELQTVQPSPDSSSQEVDHTRSEESLKSLIENSGSVSELCFQANYCRK